MIGQWVDGEDKWGGSRFFHTVGQSISKTGGQLELNLCSSHKGQEKPSSEAPSHGSLWA